MKRAAVFNLKKLILTKKLTDQHKCYQQRFLTLLKTTDDLLLQQELTMTDMKKQEKTLLQQFFLSGLITLVSFSLGAQQHQFSGWMSSFNTIKLDKKLSLHLEGQIRSNDEWVHFQTLMLRTGLNYHPNKQVILTAGYAFINNRTVKSNTSGYFTEHRLWQQLILLQPVKKFSIQHRFRLEERFIPQTSAVNNELIKERTDVAARFRYFARTIIPFKTASPFTKGMFTALQNEVFVNISNANATNNNFFDQNRAYIAVGYRFNKSTDVEAGYLNQYINGRIFNTINNVIQLAGYLRL